MTADALPTRRSLRDGTPPRSRRELRDLERVLAEQALDGITLADADVEAFVPQQVAAEPAWVDVVGAVTPEPEPVWAEPVLITPEPEPVMPEWQLEVPELEPLPFTGPGGVTAAPVTPAEVSYGSPAVLMDAPVLPALTPLEVVERQLVPLEERIAALPVAPWAVDLPGLEVLGAEAVDAAPVPRTSALGAGQDPLPVPEAGAARRAALEPGSAPRPAQRRPAVMTEDLLVRPESPWQAVWGAWIGVAAVVLWALGPVALGLGAWSYDRARKEGHGLGRPVTALVGGALGTLLGGLFLAIGL